MKRGFFVSLSTCALIAGASAQSLLGVSTFGVSNTDFPISGGGLVFPNLAEDETTDGSPAAISVTSSWTGDNSNFEEQTMEFNGYAWAQGNYGSLRTRAGGELSNTFYNSENAPYINSETGEVDPEGTPDVFDVTARAAWTDNIQVGGTANNYYSTWIFNISGTNSGPNTFSYLQVKVGTGDWQEFFFSNPGAYSYTVRTSQFILGSQPEDVQVYLTSSFQPQTQGVPEGATLAGYSDFSNTVVLAGVELRDVAGNLIDAPISSASGYQYETVPEPATMAVLGLGLAALLRRRQSK